MYLSYIMFEVAPKNNLDIDFAEYLRKMDRVLIKDKDVHEFELNILQHYTELCETHKRCKPRPLRFNRSGHNHKHDQIKLEGSHVSFFLYHSTKEFISCLK